MTKTLPAQPDIVWLKKTARQRLKELRVGAELGADPRAEDDRGNAPLKLRVTQTDKRIADSLMRAGARPSERSDNRFESAIPILNVKNVPAAITYYVD